MYVYVAQSLFSLVARFVKTSTKVHEGLIKEMLDTEDNAESRPKQPSWALDYLLSKSIIFLPFPTRTGADKSFILNLIRFHVSGSKEKKELFQEVTDMFIDNVSSVAS